MNKSVYSSSQLRQAASIQEQIEKLQAELGCILGAPTVAAVAPAPVAAPAVAAKAPSKKGMISAAGIARIKAAQKARWAKLKAAAPASSAPPAKPTAPKKFTMSAAAKAAISRAAKARWAKIRAAKKK